MPDPLDEIFGPPVGTTDGGLGATRWVAPTKTNPGHWEIQETSMGQTRWRDMTFDEFQAAEWEAEPGPLSPEFLRARFEQGPFVEPTVAPATAAGGGVAGLGPYREPGGEGVPTLTAPQFAEWQVYNARYGMTQDEYKAGVIAVQDGLAPSILDYWDYLQKLDLQRQLDEKGITQQQYDLILTSMYVYDLSEKQVQNAIDWEIPVADYAGAIQAGVEDAEIELSHLWNVPLGEWVWARQQGAGVADIQDAHLSGIPIREKILEVKRSLAEQEAAAEFDQQWAAMAAGIDDKLYTSPGFASFLTRERERQRQEYVQGQVAAAEGAARQQLPAAGVPAPSIQGPGREILTYNPATQTYEAQMPAAPEPLKIPTAEELIYKAARSGVVPTELTAAEQYARWGPTSKELQYELPRGAREVQVPQAGAGTIGGPIFGPRMGGARGVPMIGEGAWRLPLTPLGKRFAEQQLARAYLEKPGVVPTGETAESWQAKLRERYPYTAAGIVPKEDEGAKYAAAYGARRPLMLPVAEPQPEPLPLPPKPKKKRQNLAITA